MDKGACYDSFQVFGPYRDKKHRLFFVSCCYSPDHHLANYGQLITWKSKSMCPGLWLSKDGIFGTHPWERCQSSKGSRSCAKTRLVKRTTWLKQLRLCRADINTEDGRVIVYHSVWLPVTMLKKAEPENSEVINRNLQFLSQTWFIKRSLLCFSLSCRGHIHLCTNRLTGPGGCPTKQDFSGSRGCPIGMSLPSEYWVT